MKTIYECELCGKRSPHRPIIAECEAQPTMKFETIKIGDVVYADDSGYGWWGPDKRWFLDSIGDPKSESHFERGRKGYPLFVVVDINTPGYAQRTGVHREAAVLFSPAHANFHNGLALLWCPASEHKRLIKHRETTPEEFAELDRLADSIRTLGRRPDLL